MHDYYYSAYLSRFPWLLLPLWKRTVSILTRFILFLHAKWMVDSRWLERLWAFPGYRGRYCFKIFAFLPSLLCSGREWKKMSFNTLFVWNFHPSGFFTLISIGPPFWSLMKKSVLTFVYPFVTFKTLFASSRAVLKGFFFTVFYFTSLKISGGVSSSHGDRWAASPFFSSP